MNAIIKVETGVMTLRAKFAHSVLGSLSEGLSDYFIATRRVFSFVSSLMVRHLRNGGTSLSSVTPDFIY